MSLTPNAVSGMFRMSGSADNPSFSPTVQVVHLKKIDNKSGGADERWKVGYYFMHCFVFFSFLGCGVSPTTSTTTTTTTTSCFLVKEWVDFPSLLLWLHFHSHTISLNYLILFL